MEKEKSAENISNSEDEANLRIRKQLKRAHPLAYLNGAQNYNNEFDLNIKKTKKIDNNEAIKITEMLPPKQSFIKTNDLFKKATSTITSKNLSEIESVLDNDSQSDNDSLINFSHISVEKDGNRYESDDLLNDIDPLAGENVDDEDDLNLLNCHASVDKSFQSEKNCEYSPTESENCLKIFVAEVKSEITHLKEDLIKRINALEAKLMVQNNTPIEFSGNRALNIDFDKTLPITTMPELITLNVELKSKEKYESLVSSIFVDFQKYQPIFNYILINYKFRYYICRL